MLCHEKSSGENQTHSTVQALCHRTGIFNLIAEQTADGERVQRELQIAEQNLRQAKEIENQQQKNIS